MYIHKIFNKDNLTKRNCRKYSEQLTIWNCIVKGYSLRVFMYKACKEIESVRFRVLSGISVVCRLAQFVVL